MAASSSLCCPHFLVLAPESRSLGGQAGSGGSRALPCIPDLQPDPGLGQDLRFQEGARCLQCPAAVDRCGTLRDLRRVSPELRVGPHTRNGGSPGRRSRGPGGDIRELAATAPTAVSPRSTFHVSRPTLLLQRSPKRKRAKSMMRFSAQYRSMSFLSCSMNPTWPPSWGSHSRTFGFFRRPGVINGFQGSIGSRLE